MPRKTTLYIDIDDTIIAKVLPGSGFDLRPCVITHLTVLSRMYDCCWLTMWPYAEPTRPRSCQDRMSIVTMMRCLYGIQVNDSFRCAEWDRDHKQGKAEFVLREDVPKDSGRTFVSLIRPPSSDCELRHPAYRPLHVHAIISPCTSCARRTRNW
jgi:hypothetical protein